MSNGPNTVASPKCALKIINKFDNVLFVQVVALDLSQHGNLETQASLTWFLFYFCCSYMCEVMQSCWCWMSWRVLKETDSPHLWLHDIFYNCERRNQRFRPHSWYLCRSGEETWQPQSRRSPHSNISSPFLSRPPPEFLGTHYIHWGGCRNKTGEKYCVQD